MTNDVFDVSYIDILTKDLYPVPAGTEIPLDVPLVVVEGSSEGPAVATIWRNGYKDFAYSTRDYYIALGDEDVQEYAATKFWEPDPMNENDRSDRVLVDSSGGGRGPIRVVWNERNMVWVRLGGYTLECASLERAFEGVATCWELRFAHEEHDGDS